MDKTNNIPTLTTIGIDRLTSKLIDKLCKRYSTEKRGNSPVGICLY